ncbi:hypothetical protein [Thalassotalea marina]|uniref:Solute-binding protein family 3/N-terminal domain-containing protein n=1 Tax=Thalassotalea marina TaxID=1673741 RepID=A0A919EK37_9GAMM|nr:hypothetical protein [Thalassotalea marina]GHF91022.1 hypothetical protein GCM10017161_18490 [Thalassotalea marina]
MKRCMFIVFAMLINQAGAEQATQRNETLLFSVADEGQIIAWYKHYIVRTYEKIGFDVDFELIPTGREGVEAEKGYVDGLTIRVSLAELSFPHFKRVPVPLSRGELSMYCQHGVKCTREVLMTRNVTVGVVSGSNASTYYMKDKAARLYHVKNGEVLAELLHKKRIDYIISIDSPDFGNYSFIEQNTYPKVELLKIEAYHYLHQKHQDLLPKVTLALEEAIKEIGPLPIEQLRQNSN